MEYNGQSDTVDSRLKVFKAVAVQGFACLEPVAAPIEECNGFQWVKLCKRSLLMHKLMTGTKGYDEDVEVAIGNMIVEIKERLKTTVQPRLSQMFSESRKKSS